jgi:hypothetical protein
VRRHAGAASVQSSRRRIDSVRLTLGALLCLGALALSLAASGPAFGATVTQRPLLFTIDGADTPDRPMEGGRTTAVDNVTGALYLSEGNGKDEEGRIFRYHADGTPWPFPSTGLPYLSLPGQLALVNMGVAVDNSGGPNQSRLYAAGGTDPRLYAFDPSGELLWTASLPNLAGDVAVDSTGHPYVSPKDGYSTEVRKFDNVGSPPALIQSISMIGAEAIDVNTAGDVFLGTSSIEKWVGGSFSSTLDPNANDVYVDQSVPAGSIFTARQGIDERQLLVVDATAGQFRLSFGGAQTPDLPFDAGESEITAALRALPTIGDGNVNAAFTPEPPNAKQVEFRAGFLARTDVEQISCENGTTALSGGGGCSVSTIEEGAPSDAQEYASDGTLLATIGEGALLDAASVAYNPGIDRLYVLDNFGSFGIPSVVAFGPVTTGTVGDAALDTPSGIGVATAHFSGKVNPLGTNSEWYFQWRKRGESWTSAATSPPQSLPADSSDHTVEYTATSLRGGTSYQVRLVAVNTANQLVGISEPAIFATTKAAQAPAVTIGTPSAITPNGVTISGTVDPQGDSADWRVQTSTDPACATDFTDQPLKSISSSTTPVSVQADVTGLLPSEHYCVRILATNSAGSTTSEAKEFETLEAQPSQVFAAYAAPRTDTTARLNGYVNPEGSAATYRFEYSLDGSTWSALPDSQTSEARRQIVVAGEVTGLQPATTYHYRFVVENDAGPVQSDEKDFETRTAAEMQLPQRGVELVNNPDKGNQNLTPDNPEKVPFVSQDGNRAVWRVFAGAPGGNTGTEVNFLAIRSASGWHSQSLAPPAAEQVGGGERAYKGLLATPDLRFFLMKAVQTAAFDEGPPTFVRIDDQGRQDILKAFAQEAHEGYENADMTSDGAHVITPNVETKQLEEIGTEPHEVVSIMPDGQPAECGVAPNDFYGTGGNGVAAESWRFPDYHRMATTDGSRLYFEAFPNGGSCSEGNGHHQAIYYRDRNAGQTVEVDPGTAQTPPVLIRATPDGRSVAFTTRTSHSPEDENGSGDVYRWDSEGDSYTCLTCVVDEAAVAGRVVVSTDLSHVYFSSLRRLVPGHGMPGESSLYSVSDGDLGYVSPGDSTLLVRASLSSDGDVLVFKSNKGKYSQLTADRQATECLDRFSGLKESNCEALFRYEDSTNSLECLSCLPGGVTTIHAGQTNAIAALSSDGRTVAFVTFERLLPEDINNAADVYEWHNGALQLVTDGETAYSSNGIGSAPRVYGMGDDGRDIFFTVVQPGLTGYEHDRVANLYDARIGGGFPRPIEAPHCSEESCQGPLVAPPPELRTGSSGLNGAGNEAPAKKGRCAAKRGKARSRCLHKKQRKHKKRSAKRSGSQRIERGTK